MNTFTHLHTHTIYTAGNSTLAIADLVKQAQAFGMDATAIVDSGTIAGFEPFREACHAHNIRPIYGCGFYLANGSRLAPRGRSHLVLLAYNQSGMAHLRQLDQIAQTEGLHGGKAHIDSVLLPQHSKGLICLTGGLGGPIDKLIVAGDLENATRHAKFFQRIYHDNFYLELQDHGSPKNRIAIKGLCEISKKTGIPMIVSQGAFYLNPDDAEGCNQVRKLNKNKPLNGNQYHFRSAAEMRALFQEYPEALANTERVARQCLQA